MARSERLEFVWEAPAPGEQGFAWAECRFWDSTRRSPGLALVRRDDAAFAPYLPLDDNLALHRRFAETEPTPEGILDFAGRFGCLGRGAETMADIFPIPGVLRKSWLVEPFEEWRTRVVWMREALRVWDMVVAGDRKGLAEVFKWEGRGRVYYERPAAVWEALGLPLADLPRKMVAEWIRDNKEREVIASNPDGGAPEGFRPGDVLLPARLWVYRFVNGYMADTVSPDVSWDFKRGRPVWRELPHSLLGAIYLQFAKAVYDGRPVRRCQVCGRPFELARGENRTDRQTCSNSCRTRAYRERRQQARELHARGKTAKQIAKELGSKLEHVKKWIGSERS